MSKMSEAKIIEKFREHIKRKVLTDDVKLTYRIAGGMPSQRVEEEFKLSGSGKSLIASRDVLRGAGAQEAAAELDQAETHELLKKIGSGLDSLVPRSKARFLPDSAVGTITIEIEGKETTLFFLADEEDRSAQNSPISPEISEAIQSIRDISKRSLKKSKGQDNG